MKFISRSEEYLLLAVLRLEDQAYGVAIREQLKSVTGQTWAFGALFIMLSRLEKKGLLASFLADPTPQRGGKSKRFYRLTDNGLRTLNKIRKVQENVWKGIGELPQQD